MLGLLVQGGIAAVTRCALLLLLLLAWQAIQIAHHHQP